MSFIRAYLRASTTEQNASRAKQSLIDFAADHNHKIASFHTENESGRKLDRPELMKLLEDANQGDIILCESIDRISRLTADDWEALKLMIAQKGLTIVALDLPTSHMALTPIAQDDSTSGILKAINNMLMDMMAVFASKDYTQRRERQSQGIAKKKAEGGYKGRQPNTERNEGIANMLKGGMSYSAIQAATGASRTTIAKIKKTIS